MRMKAPQVININNATQWIIIILRILDRIHRELWNKGSTSKCIKLNVLMIKIVTMIKDSIVIHSITIRFVRVFKIVFYPHPTLPIIMSIIQIAIKMNLINWNSN